MAVVNMNNLLNVKDSRWLQLEVCREFQRNKCTRPDTECKFAHPPANVEVQNGRVTACYDSIKGRCNREKPPCKYFHPPQHLKDQLLINGRNHLALKNALMQQMGLTPGQPLVPGQVPTVATSPYLPGMPQVGSTFSPYFTPGPIMPVMTADPGIASPLGVVQQTVVPQQKMTRSDRLEAFPGMVPYKRPAGDKSGVPMYQPNATTYQQLMQLQQPFVPVSCEYGFPPQNPTATTTVTATPCSPSPSTPNASGDIVPNTVVSSVSVSEKTDVNQQLISVNNNNNNIVATAVSAANKEAQNNFINSYNSAKLAAAAAAAAAITSSASTHSYPVSPLTALTYTGVALNKQMMYPTTQFRFAQSTPQIPYFHPTWHAMSAAASAMSRPPTPVQAAFSAAMPYMQRATHIMQPQNPVMNGVFAFNGNTMLPAVASTSAINPYKKMKTI